MATPQSLAVNLLSVATRLLTFRASPKDFDGLRTRHLVFGLVFTWLAGMGRYWDSPHPHIVQSMGRPGPVQAFAGAIDKAFGTTPNTATRTFTPSPAPSRLARTVLSSVRPLATEARWA